MERMSGRLTPPEVTPLDGLQITLLPIADLFMILMLSRPPGGSLRTARVTPVTIGLAAVLALLAGLAALALVSSAIATSQYLFIPIALLDGALGLGAAVLTIFGVRQRMLIAAAGKGRPH